MAAQGLQPLAAQGLQLLAAHGLQPFAAHGLHAFALHGLHALHAWLAAFAGLSATTAGAMAAVVDITAIAAAVRVLLIILEPPSFEQPIHDERLWGLPA